MTEYAKGLTVECIEKPGYLDGFRRGGRYVIVDVEHHHGTRYLKILGDDDRAHVLLYSMFRVVH